MLKPIKDELLIAIPDPSIEANSKPLKRELTLRDLVLMQIIFVVGPSWIGTAGKLGSSHLVFWALAILLFYIPVAVVVTYLSRLLPLEGGLYQWTKLGFNQVTGFFIGWNLWLFAIINMSTTGIETATYLSYAFGSKTAWLAESKAFIATVNISIFALLICISVFGLALGKWVHNIGGIVALGTFAILVIAGLVGTTKSNRFLVSWPDWSFYNVNILSKISFGAFGGLEYAAIVAGECRKPSVTLSRSVMIAGPILAVLYVAGTGSLLTFVSPEKIDLVGPIPQVLRLAFQHYSILIYIIQAVIIAQLTLNITSTSVNFTGNTRLPMVAGWDHLLPQWFSNLHRRYRTPINSIIVMGVVTTALGIISQLGVKPQEAFQLLSNTTGVFYAVAYIAMFAIPIFGLKQMALKVPLKVRVAAAVGLLMVFIYVFFSIFPIISVESRPLFAAKIGITAFVANIVGLALFLSYGIRHARRNGAIA